VSLQIKFHGAAGEVTGSCFEVDTGSVRFLVDCGMFQGGREADAKNRRFGFEPRDIAFVLLTHAHIDHSGLIPRLVAQGFTGAVYATAATCDLAAVMLPDSGHLQEKEAEREGTAALYTQREAQASLVHFVPVEYDAEVRPHHAVRCRFRDAGHILGSAILEVRVGGKTLV
jgi:metallo-beta-lactamase family protein